MTKRRSRPLTDFQKRFAQEVVTLGLATLDEALAAFHWHDDDQIEAWKPAVYAERAKRRAAYEEKLNNGEVVLRTVACAWCGASINIVARTGQRVEPTPIRMLYLSEKKIGQDIPLYGCCSECIRQIHKAEVVITLRKESTQQ